MNSALFFRPDPLLRACAIQSLHDAILNTGVAEVQLRNDIGGLEVASREAREKNRLGDHFSRALNTIAPETFCWVGLYDRGGRCIGTCAARLDSTPGWSLQHHIRQYVERLWTTSDGRPVRLNSASLEFVSSVAGRTVYLGEGEIRKDWRGNRLLGLVTRLIMLSVFDEWKPDLFYAFIRPDNARRGKHTEWGFSMQKSNSLIWDLPPEQSDLHDLNFVAVGHEGILRLCHDPLLPDRNRDPLSSRTELTG